MNITKEQEKQIEIFADLVETHQKEVTQRKGFTCDANIQACITSVKYGKKYARVDVGSSGKYIVDESGDIFGIKAYGVIHRGHRFGNINTVHEWYWGEYRGYKIKGENHG